MKKEKSLFFFEKKAERQGLQKAFIYKNNIHDTAKAINKSISE